MATATLPVQIGVTLNAPTDPGVEVADRVFEALLSAKPYSNVRYDFTGSGSKALDVPANPQLIFIIYESGTAAIELDFGTDVVTLKAGGMFLVVNPSAATNLGITINYTSAAVVRAMMYG